MNIFFWPPKGFLMLWVAYLRSPPSQFFMFLPTICFGPHNSRHFEQNSSKFGKILFPPRVGTVLDVWSYSNRPFKQYALCLYSLTERASVFPRFGFYFYFSLKMGGNFPLFFEVSLFPSGVLPIPYPAVWVPQWDFFFRLLRKWKHYSGGVNFIFFFLIFLYQLFEEINSHIIQKGFRSLLRCSLTPPEPVFPFFPSGESVAGLGGLKRCFLSKFLVFLD